MFQPDASWSLPAHLFEVSEWSARCSRKRDPHSCANDDQLGGFQTLIRSQGQRRRRPGIVRELPDRPQPPPIGQTTTPSPRSTPYRARTGRGRRVPEPDRDAPSADLQRQRPAHLPLPVRGTRRDAAREDDFLSGERLDPGTDGRPDPRPDVRENQPALGNLTADFNFSQNPLPPLILPTHPPPLASTP